MTRIFLAVFFVFLFSLTAISTEVQVSAPAENNNTFHLALVNNVLSKDISVIDTQTQTEIKRIPFPEAPYVVAMTGDGLFAYVAGNRNIYKLDLNTLSIIKTLNVSLASSLSYFVELETFDKYLVAADVVQAEITIVDTVTDQEIGRVILCSQCNGVQTPINATVTIDFIPNTPYAVAYKGLDGVVHVIDLNKAQEIGQFQQLSPPLGESSPGDIVVMNFGGKDGLSQPLILVNFGGGTVPLVGAIAPFQNTSAEVNVTNGYTDIETFSDGFAVGDINYDANRNNDFITVVGPSLNKIINIPVSESSRYLTYNPATNHLYSLCIAAGSPYNDCHGSGAIDIVSLQKYEKIKTLTLDVTFALPALSREGKYFYVPLKSDKIAVIDAKTLSVVTSIPVGQSPKGVFMQGDNFAKPIY